MALLRFYFPHESTGKIPPHKAALAAFGSGVRGGVCRFTAAVTDAEVCAWTALKECRISPMKIQPLRQLQGARLHMGVVASSALRNSQLQFDDTLMAIDPAWFASKA